MTESILKSIPRWISRQVPDISQASRPMVSRCLSLTLTARTGPAGGAN
jgi:hypothetical protein